MTPVLAIPFIMLGAIVAWGILRLRRGRAAIRTALQQQGCKVLEMKRRIIRLGPFSRTTTRSQIVYRVLVHQADGRQRTIWARWGRTWLPKPDQLELAWDE